MRVRELAQPLGLQVHDEPEQARAVLVSLARGDVLLAKLHLDLLAARVGRREAHVLPVPVDVVELLTPQLLAEDHQPPRHKRVDVRPRGLLVEGGEHPPRLGLRRHGAVATDHLHRAELALQRLG